ncbi:hypothetical protein PGB90_007143 [Kerria lacca]
MNSDRFILNRKQLDVDTANFWIKHETMKENMEKYMRNTPLVKQDINRFSQIQRNEFLGRILGVKEGRKILPFIINNSINANIYKNTNSWPVIARTKPVYKPQLAVLDLPNIRNDICCNVLHWSSNDHIIAALGKIIYMWHVPSATMSKSINCFRDVISLRMDMDSTALAFSCDETYGCEIKIWNLFTSKIIEKRGPLGCSHSCYITCIEYHCSNKFMIIGCKKGNMAVTTTELERISHVRYAHNLLDIIKIKCSPNGKYVASSGYDGYVNIWSFPHLELLHSFYQPFCSRGISWHPWESSYLCIGTTNGTLSLINTALGKCLDKVTDEASIIYDITFNKLSGELVTSQCFCESGDPGSYGSQINVLSRLNRVVDRFEGHNRRVLFLEWSPDNTILASAGSDETIHLWKFFGAMKKNKFKKNIIADCFNLEKFIR